MFGEDREKRNETTTRSSQLQLPLLTYSMLIVVVAVADSVTVRHIIWQMINADMVAYYHFRLFWLTSQTHVSL